MKLTLVVFDYYDWQMCAAWKPVKRLRQYIQNKSAFCYYLRRQRGTARIRPPHVVLLQRPAAAAIDNF